MQNNWKKYKFSELYDVASGLSKSRDQFGFGSPFVTFRNVFYNYFLPNKLGELANTNKKEQERGSVKKGDVFLTRTSETLHELGMSSVALKDYPNATFNGFCKRLRLKDNVKDLVDPVFIGYYLRSNHFRNEVSKYATMTTRASLNNTSINSLEVKLPSINEQIKIGKVLKSLHDKIELNLKTNKTLEEMAMALYKNYFVDFEPFKNKPFIDSELGKIPQGWEVKRIGEICKLEMGQSPKSKYYNKDKNGLPFHQGVKDYGLRFPEDITYSTEGTRKAKEGDILFSVRAPVGRLNIAKNEIILGRGIASLSMNNFDNNFLFYALKNFFTKDDIIGDGTVYKSVNRNEISSLKFIFPTDKIISDFNNEVSILDNLYFNKNKEIQTLTKTRDTLLPKLISGEIELKQAEEELN